MRIVPASVRSGVGASLALALAFASAAGASPQAATPARSAGKTGSVRVEYLPPKDPRHRELADSVRQRRVLERFAEVLSPVRLPKPLTLSFQGCDGESNAWYSPAKGKVIFCYEYVADLARIAKPAAEKGIDADEAREGAMAFVLLHETSHALFDILAVPLLGQEEDAADQVAGWMLLRAGRDVAHRALRAAAWMYLSEARARTTDESDLADVHGLNAQRYYNVLCLAYGSDAEFFGGIVHKGYLPADRAEGCEEEWQQVNYAAKALLLKHVDAATAARVRERYQKRWGEKLKGTR
ncbi:MAG TPA: DUF4344 domain-containing metallopeptidase [Anaeromyxobacteraceae bacterium]|nr:DUF4344 domain-containing metallopeptidase [Anaeromyxobacteraceae bacterium]